MRRGNALLLFAVLSLELALFSLPVRGQAVVLDADVSESFPNSESVNKALRTLATVARRSVGVQRRSASPKKRPNKRLQQTRSAKRGRSGPRS